MGVVIISEFAKLPHQVERIPEKHVIEIFASNGSNQPFDKGMRNRDAGDRLDLLDLEYAQIGQPTVKAEQGVVIGADVFGWWLAGDGVVEHPAYGDAVNRSGFDAKADESSRKDVHDHHYPVTAEEDRFAAEEIDAPETIFGLADQGKPRRSPGARSGSVVSGEDSTNNVFVELYAEGVRDLLGDAHAAETRVTALHL